MDFSYVTWSLNFIMYCAYVSYSILCRMVSVNSYLKVHVLRLFQGNGSNVGSDGGSSTQLQPYFVLSFGGKRNKSQVGTPLSDASYSWTTAAKLLLPESTCPSHQGTAQAAPETTLGITFFDSCTKQALGGASVDLSQVRCWLMKTNMAMTMYGFVISWSLDAGAQLHFFGF